MYKDAGCHPNLILQIHVENKEAVVVQNESL